MPTMYDSQRVFQSTFLTGNLFQEVLCSLTFWMAIALFFLENEVVSRVPTERLRWMNDEISWPATLFSTLFSFMLALFTNNCYERYKDNWRAATTGWSRINNLGLQVFAYVEDRALACEVMRLMHAANHLCYADFAGRDETELVSRRHLLKDSEIAILTRTSNGFYLCACWAMEMLRHSTIDRILLGKIDESVREWRQQTTLLPLIQLTPLPLPYFRIMVVLTFVFEALVGLKLLLSFAVMGTTVDMEDDLQLNLHTGELLEVRSSLRTPLQFNSTLPP